MPRKIVKSPESVKTAAAVAEVRKLMENVTARYQYQDGAAAMIFKKALGPSDFTTSGIADPEDLDDAELAKAADYLREVIECGPRLPSETVIPFPGPATPSAGSENDDDDGDDAFMQAFRMEGFSRTANVVPLDYLDPDAEIKNIKQLCNRWVWCVGIERFIDRCDPLKQWKVKQFDSKYNWLVNTASVSQMLFKYKRVNTFDAMAFTPGRREFNDASYNTWRPSKVIAAKGDTTLWDEHLRWLFPDDTTRNMVLNWLAWVYQNQDRKPMHALLLVGETMGTGKSYIARVLEHLLGLENTQRPKNSSLDGDFNAWAAHCKLILIEELMQMNKREVEGALRDIITEPTVEVNIKNISAFKVPSYSAMMAVSNHTDALSLIPGDRRWAVAETPITLAEKQAKIDAGYFARLMPMVDNDEPDMKALGAIAYQLKTRKLDNYSALGEAPITDAKRTMIAYSKKSLVAWLESERENDPLTRRVVSIRADIIPLIPQDVMRDSRNPEVLITKWLKKELGATTVVQAKIAGRVIRLWAINGTTYRWPDEVAAMYRADRAGKKLTAANDDEPADDFLDAE